MDRLTIELPEEALAALGLSSEEAAREARLMLAISWFGQGRISQGTGSRLAGLSRVGFIAAMGRAKVSPIQVTSAELSEEICREAVADRER